MKSTKNYIFALFLIFTIATIVAVPVFAAGENTTFSRLFFSISGIVKLL